MSTQTSTSPPANPHKFELQGGWGATRRAGLSSYNDNFLGVQNHKYAAPKVVPNQGYDSITMTFPQATFSSCRYPASQADPHNRTPDVNNWHLDAKPHDPQAFTNRELRPTPVAPQGPNKYW